MATSSWTSRPLQAASARSRTTARGDTGSALRQWTRKATCLLGLLQLVPALLAAQGERLAALFPARPAGYLTDVAGIVAGGEAAEIASWAERLRSATGAELAVVTLPTIGDAAPSDVALAIGRRWGVGAQGEAGDSAKNAGIVLLLVPQQNHQPGTGRLWIATGRGIEGIMTDAIVGRITDLMVPALQQEQYGPALTLGARAIAATVAKGFGVSDSALTNADPFRGGQSTSGSPVPAIVFVIILVIVLTIIAQNSGRGGGGRGGRRPRYGGTGIGWGGGGSWGGGGGSWGGGWGGGGGFGGGGGGGFGGFGGGGGFSGGGAGRSF